MFGDSGAAPLVPGAWPRRRSTALLADLRDRGMRTDRPALAVIDGAKALARATRNVFGEYAIRLVQETPAAG